MAANALPPHTAIQALVASTIPVSSGVSRFFDGEHRVNDFQNHVLFRLYDPRTTTTVVPPRGGPTGLAPSPSTPIVISAEIYPRATDTSGDRADLAVSDIVPTTGSTATTPSYSFTQNFKLIYEGKGGTAGDSPDSIKGQLQRFLLTSDVGHTTPC